MSIEEIPAGYSQRRLVRGEKRLLGGDTVGAFVIVERAGTLIIEVNRRLDIVCTIDIAIAFHRVGRGFVITNVATEFHFS